MLNDGKSTINTSCLGDLFTINMMNDLEAHGKNDRNLGKFAREIRTRTAAKTTAKVDEKWGGSHVMWYGDLEMMKNYTVGDFMNNPKGQYHKEQMAKK